MTAVTAMRHTGCTHWLIFVTGTTGILGSVPMWVLAIHRHCTAVVNREQIRCIWVGIQCIHVGAGRPDTDTATVN